MNQNLYVIKNIIIFINIGENHNKKGPKMKKEKFDIQGMTCSSCQSHVEKAISSLAGIQKLNVNLLSNSMIVEYDENALDNNKIIEAVVEAGFNANVYVENNGMVLVEAGHYDTEKRFVHLAADYLQKKADELKYNLLIIRDMETLRPYVNY